MQRQPFAAELGFLRLEQDTITGATLLQFDLDGAEEAGHGWRTLLTLQGVDKDDITSDNFVGGIPPDGSAVPGQVLTGLAKRTTPGLVVRPAFEPDEVAGIAASTRPA